jgi:hypothetical protein
MSDSQNINTVAELIARLSKYPDDLVIESYVESHGLPRGVTLMHYVPSSEEASEGCYEVLCFCADTLPTHRLAEIRSTTKDN